MMTARRLSRRLVLRSASVALPLPFLSAMAPRRSEAARPKRLIVFSTANGTVLADWRPKGTESSFTFGPILAPLAPHAKDVVVLDGVEAMTEGPGNGHPQGAYCMLTGVPLVTVNGQGTGAARSVDQIIASKVGAGTKLRTLDLGVLPIHLNGFANFVSFLGPNQPVMPDPNPVTVFRRLFAALPESGADRLAFEALRVQRKSVLDSVFEDYQALSRRVDPGDRRTLEAHATTLRGIETRLTAPMPMDAPACARPKEPDRTIDPKSDAQLPAIGALQTDLLVTALACDLTRVGVLLWGGRGNNVSFPSLQVAEQHHELSHTSGSVAAGKLTRINRFYMERLAALIAALKARSEAGGTLFEQTLVFACNDLGDGGTHGHRDVPYVLAGNAGGAFPTGRYLRFNPRVTSNDVLVSLMNAMGLADTSFGKREWCTGPVRGLV